MNQELGCSLPTPQWNTIKFTLDFLEKFARASEEMSASKQVSLSKAFIYMSELLEHVEEALHKPISKVLDLQAMHQKLLKYRDDIQKSALLPSYLDPATHDYLSNGERLAAIKVLKTMLPKEDNKAESSMGKTFSQMMRPTHKDDNSTKGYPELEEFSRKPKLELGGDSLTWWATHAKEIPALATIARTELAKLASSALRACVLHCREHHHREEKSPGATGH